MPRSTSNRKIQEKVVKAEKVFGHTPKPIPVIEPQTMFDVMRIEWCRKWHEARMGKKEDEEFLRHQQIHAACVARLNGWDQHHYG